MAGHRTIRNYDVFGGHSHYVPGYKGMIALLLLLLAGAALGSFVSFAVMAAYKGELPMEIIELISYPLMFVPPMMYVGIKSRNNALFETGYALDSSHFGKPGPWLCALMVIVATLATAFMTDLLNSKMPEMPKWLADALEAMTQGNVWINFLCVSVMAPIFEEWLCRGMILRGLLNSKKDDGSRLVSPGWAIVISALFFALIHGNPWQAIPAFLLGCLFGYVYFKTGSLKLTMLMHFANNTFALICSNICPEGAEFWTDMMPSQLYGILFVACGLLLVLILRTFHRIELQSPAGNCDEIKD